MNASHEEYIKRLKSKIAEYQSELEDKEEELDILENQVWKQKQISESIRTILERYQENFFYLLQVAKGEELTKQLTEELENLKYKIGKELKVDFMKEWFF